MTDADWIKKKRQQVEDYLEAQMSIGKLTKIDAHKIYAETIAKLKEMSSEELKEITLDSL
ncbi:MAG: hypothetical protein HQK51_20860 [Oligoflexia bacterium]|nr:hypothetical protein [Oligoflexia bacterium]